MPDELCRRVRKEEPDAAVIRSGGMLQPFRAFYRKSLLERIDPASGRGLYSLLRSVRTAVIDDTEESLININRPEDLEMLRNPEL
jgi:molybdopterin-guanine dinucleotide biosynthesis protein A